MQFNSFTFNSQLHATASFELKDTLRNGKEQNTRAHLNINKSQCKSILIVITSQHDFKFWFLPFHSVP